MEKAKEILNKHWQTAVHRYNNDRNEYVLNAMREYAQINCSEIRERLRDCKDALSQVYKMMEQQGNANSLLGLQVKLTIEKVSV